MNKRQIITELRRSAKYGDEPWVDVAMEAFRIASQWTGGRFMGGMPSDDLRTYFLLVAHALEDGRAPR